MTPTIRRMTRDDLALVLTWAEAEGWNPGLDDAEHFYAADPDGFFLAEVGGAPAASISIIRTGEAHAFLGLDLCRADLRGRGLGTAVWTAAMAERGGVSIGLDGVVAQQESYARAGFVRAHATYRFAGTVPSRPLTTVALSADDLPAALALDSAASGFARRDFLTRWLAPAPGRHARAVHDEDGRLRAYGAMRACVVGWKIGPVHARDRAAAGRVIGDLASLAREAPVMLDVPGPNAPALDIARRLGLEPVFETARMWRGTPPQADVALEYGVCSLEAG